MSFREHFVNVKIYCKNKIKKKKLLMGNCYDDRMDSIPDLVHYRSRTVVVISSDEEMGLSKVFLSITKKLDKLNTHYKFKS